MRLFGFVAVAAILAAVGVSHAMVRSVAVGDAVEASPLMIDSRWESCTVTALLPGGDVGVACGPRRTEYVVQGKWVRPASTRAAPAAPAPTSRLAQTPVPAANCADAPRGLVGNRRQENGICRIGARVADREGRTGTVIDAPDRTMCRVCLTAGTSRDYLTWMLSVAGGPAASAAPAAGGAPSGSYQCYGGQAGNMRITISNGRWQDFYAEALPDGKVGISSQPNGRPYYMVCERR